MTDLFDRILAAFEPELEVSEPAVADGDTIECLLTDIYADYDWNSRRGNWQADIAEIERSMLPDGDSGPIRQDLPGVVRPHTPTEEHPEPYSLVSGFSRYTALVRIAKRLGLENVTMTVKLRALDEPDALEQNIRENVGRNQQRTVDIAFQLHKAWLTRGMENAIWLTPLDLAPRVALNPGLVKSLLRIMRDGDKSMLEAWRNCQLTLNHADIEKIVSKHPKPGHLEAFKRLVAGIDADKSPTVSKYDPKHKVLITARKYGRLLAVLERTNCIRVVESNLQEASAETRADLLDSFGRNVSAQSIANEILGGYREQSSDVGYRTSAIGQNEKDNGKHNV